LKISEGCCKTKFLKGHYLLTRISEGSRKSLKISEGVQKFPIISEGVLPVDENFRGVQENP
jgi:hypothetical protein